MCLQNNKTVLTSYKCHYHSIKSAKDITAKIIEVKPYKWIEVIDNQKRKVEEEFLKNAESGCITEKIALFTGVKYLKITFISDMVGHSSLGYNSFSRGREYKKK